MTSKEQALGIDVLLTLESLQTKTSVLNTWNKDVDKSVWKSLRLTGQACIYPRLQDEEKVLWVFWVTYHSEISYI